jgi:hypothetical protein
MFSLGFQVTGSDEIDYTLVIECDGRRCASTGRIVGASGPCSDNHEQKEKAPKKDADLHSALLIVSGYFIRPSPLFDPRALHCSGRAVFAGASLEIIVYLNFGGLSATLTQSVLFMVSDFHLAYSYCQYEYREGRVS